MSSRVDVYVESGAKRVFAGALDWPGWCRQGRTEDEALAALVEYGVRYGAIISRTRLGFVAPTEARALVVKERLKGNATTDFGAPAIAPSIDAPRTCTEAEVKRFASILGAGWKAFDKIAAKAKGKTLTTGPRGGGRALAQIIDHVNEADANYVRAVGWKAPKAAREEEQMSVMREAILEALAASAAGKIPEEGPRGGARWTARYFARRVTWHVFAHVWEIERRMP